MRRVLGVLNLLCAGAIALLLYPLFLLVTGEIFDTPDGIGVVGKVGGADGPTHIYLAPSRPVAVLVLVAFLLALFLCNAAVLWRASRPVKERKTDD